MKEYPEEKAKVIKQYEILQHLFCTDKVKFESETKRAIEKVILEAENESSRINLKRMQARLTNN